MKITADEKCYLTEVADVSLDKRTFRQMVIVQGPEDAAQWKQITEEEKASMEAQAALFGNQNITREYLSNVSTLLSGIKEKINEIPMSAADALANKQFFPTFDEIIGREINVGYRFTSGEDMYESLQTHTVSVELKPDSVTDSTPVLLAVAAETASKETTKYYKLVK